MIRNLFLFIWDTRITHWYWVDIERYGLKSKQKYNILYCTLYKLNGSLGIHNAMHNNRLKPVCTPLSAVEWFDMRLPDGYLAMTAVLNCHAFCWEIVIANYQNFVGNLNHRVSKILYALIRNSNFSVWCSWNVSQACTWARVGSSECRVLYVHFKSNISLVKLELQSLHLLIKSISEWE